MQTTWFTLPGGWRAMGWSADGAPTDALREWLARLVGGPQGLEGLTTLKYSGSVEVLKASAPPGIGAEHVVCKHAKTGGSPVASRARRNFHRGRRLLSANIETAQPLALLERGRESWLVTEYLPELVDLDQFALTLLPRLEMRKARRVKASVGKCVAALFARLRESGLHHRDLKASNIMLAGLGASNAGAACRAVILDLDGLRSWTVLRSAAERARLWRLAASMLQYRSITRTDYARFLRSYLDATSRNHADWRRWFRETAAAAAKYNRQAAGRKAGKLDGYAG